MTVRKRNMTDAEFWLWFELKVKNLTPINETGCIEWIGARSLGYGIVRRNGRNLRVHRLTLERSLGRSLAQDMYALHSCNNPPCCNPEHLREGTNQENVDDKLRADRQPRGETNGKAKLTIGQVNDIRANIDSLSQQMLADRYGVQKACIAKIQRGKTWNLHTEV
jgi:hypothetical protein